MRIVYLRGCRSKLAVDLGIRWNCVLVRARKNAGIMLRHNLSQVGLGRIGAHSGTVLHASSHMGVIGHAETGDELDLVDRRLAEGVLG